jgi:hypothetical protein
LLEVDFATLPLAPFYRAADLLMRHRTVIEQTIFTRVNDLFGLDWTVTLYDLTNTFFEGAAAGNPKAQRGHSKEKRSDCPLVTLGLVLDGSGFVRRSQTFDGAVSEGTTLDGMLRGLGARRGALVVMDAGIATAENILWLRAQGYRYLVVSRERQRGHVADDGQWRGAGHPTGARRRRRGGAAVLLFRMSGRQGTGDRRALHPAL